MGSRPASIAATSSRRVASAWPAARQQREDAERRSRPPPRPPTSGSPRTACRRDGPQRQRRACPPASTGVVQALRLAGAGCDSARARRRTSAMCRQPAASRRGSGARAARGSRRLLPRCGCRRRWSAQRRGRGERRRPGRGHGAVVARDRPTAVSPSASMSVVDDLERDAPRARPRRDPTRPRQDRKRRRALGARAPSLRSFASASPRSSGSGIAAALAAPAAELATRQREDDEPVDDQRSRQRAAEDEPVGATRRARLGLGGPDQARQRIVSSPEARSGRDAHRGCCRRRRRSRRATTASARASSAPAVSCSEKGAGKPVVSSSQRLPEADGRRRRRRVPSRQPSASTMSASSSTIRRSCALTEALHLVGARRWRRCQIGGAHRSGQRERGRDDQQRRDLRQPRQPAVEERTSNSSSSWRGGLDVQRTSGVECAPHDRACRRQA